MCRSLTRRASVAMLVLTIEATSVFTSGAAVPPGAIEFQAPDPLSTIGPIDDEPVSKPPAPGVSPATKAVPTKVRTGNPLWAIPLGSLNMTRDRPIFSPMRRPPAVAALVITQPVIHQDPPPPAPEPLNLLLLGTVSGDSEKIAVLLDPTTNNVLRLRLGQSHSAWVLQSVDGISVIMQRGPATETLVLRRKDGQASGIPMSSGAPSQLATSPTFPTSSQIDDGTPSGIDMR